MRRALGYAIALAFALAMGGCATSVTYCELTPPVGWCGVCKEAHVPIVDQPMRIAQCRPELSTRVYHFDTEAPSTITDHLGAAGPMLNDTSVVRSAVGF